MTGQSQAALAFSDGLDRFWNLGVCGQSDLMAYLPSAEPLALKSFDSGAKIAGVAIGIHITRTVANNKVIEVFASFGRNPLGTRPVYHTWKRHPNSRDFGTDGHQHFDGELIRWILVMRKYHLKFA